MDTLNTFFDTQSESPEWAKGITESQQFAQAEQLISQELAGFQVPPSFYELMIVKLCEALDIEISNILVWGWRKNREIVQYRDQDNPPGGSHQVPLLEHALVSKHSPTIQPVINNVPLAKLKFEIALKLKLKGVKLFIRDGKIMEVKTGTCTGNGSIEYGGYNILEKKQRHTTCRVRLFLNKASPSEWFLKNNKPVIPPARHLHRVDLYFHR